MRQAIRLEYKEYRVNSNQRERERNPHKAQLLIEIRTINTMLLRWHSVEKELVVSDALEHAVEAHLSRKEKGIMVVSICDSPSLSPSSWQRQTHLFHAAASEHPCTASAKSRACPASLALLLRLDVDRLLCRLLLRVVARLSPVCLLGLLWWL